jgi:molybdenum cofactor cytidylyltransferase
MGRPKALLQYGGETFLDSLLRIYAQICSPAVTVLGEHAAVVRASSMRIATSLTVINPQPENGQFSSLQLGLRVVPGTCNRIFFHPVDAPGILLSTLQRMLDALGNQMVCIPVYRGKHGHPVLINRDVAQIMLAAPLHSNARAVLRWMQARTVWVEVEDPAITRDIDTPADLRTLDR